MKHFTVGPPTEWLSKAPGAPSPSTNPAVTAGACTAQAQQPCIAAPRLLQRALEVRLLQCELAGLGGERERSGSIFYKLARSSLQVVVLLLCLLNLDTVVDRQQVDSD